ncbi:MAG: ferritin family protein [Melioribacteraceae bacterium]|nr:ferritin family protein [Melioribacteraceae bacterium]
MLTEEYTALEALGIAIRSEIDAQELYSDLASRCDDEVLRNRFLNMHHEERRHQFILQKKYEEMFPDVDLVLPESTIPKDYKEKILSKNLRIVDILSLALKEEKKSREFYLDCAETVQDLSGKRMFRFLADMEFQHQAMISNEIEMLEKYPNYFEGKKPWDVESRLRTEKIKRRED